MLMRFDPFREFDRLADQLWGGRNDMPMDAYRQGDELLVELDLPGVDQDSLDVTVDQNVLTVSATRGARHPDGAEIVAAERPQGTFTRRLFLGDSLDADRVSASYDAGVLTLHIPVAEHAKPRKVEITSNGGAKQIEAAATAA